MKCVNIECNNKQYNANLCRKHYGELTGSISQSRVTLKLGDFCSKGHKIEGDNVSAYSRNGKEYVSCKLCRSENSKASAPVAKIGDECSKGHKIMGENVDYVTTRAGQQSVRCRKCRLTTQRERQRRFRQSPEYREYLALRRAQYANESDKRAQRYDKILAVEITQGNGSYTGLNYLKLGKRAQRAWEPLAEKFDTERGLCKGNPVPWIDYDDENEPSPNRAFQLCNGCPLLVECGRFAAAYKPVIGVWGGEVYRDGKVVGK